jgi:hypothetical protein
VGNLGINHEFNLGITKIEIYGRMSKCGEKKGIKNELKGFGMFQVVSGYYRLFQVVTGCFRLFQVVSDCYRLFQVVTGCYRLFQIVQIVSGFGF